MNKYIFWTFFLGIFLFVHIVYATEINSCTQITSPGYYELTTDITSSVSECIQIESPDVVFDCKYHEIVSTSQGSNTAIKLLSATYNTTNITIKNCVIKDFDYGIWKDVGYRDLVKIENVRIYNSKKGIYIYNLNNGVIENITISSNNIYSDSYIYGIFIRDSSYIEIQNSNISYINVISQDYNAYGLNMKGSYISIENSNVTNNKYGLYVEDGSQNINITNVTIKENKKGIYFDLNNPDTFLINSEIYDNDENVVINPGIYGATVCPNYHFENVTGETGKYIEFYTGEYLKIEDEQLSQLILCGVNHSVVSNVSVEDSDGIILLYSKNNTIENSSVKFSFYGIKLEYSNNNTINKTFIVNSTYGIYLYNSNFSLIYNNLLNNSNITILSSGENWLNTTNQTGERIIYTDLPYIGGNYYWKSDGTGYSQVCDDENHDGFCDLPYDTQNNIGCDIGSCGEYTDYLPLADPFYYLDSCTNLTESNTTYYLIKDVNSSEYEKCFDIRAENITIDCEGHKIFDYNTGIYYLANTTGFFDVKNCIFENLDNSGSYSIYINVTNPENLNVDISVYNITIHNGKTVINTIKKSNITNVSCENASFLFYSNSEVYINDFNANKTSIELFNTLNSEIKNVWIDKGNITFKNNTNITIENASVKNSPKIDIFTDSCSINLNNVNVTGNTPLLLIKEENYGLLSEQNTTEIIICNSENFTIEDLSFNNSPYNNNGIFIIDSKNVSVKNSTFSNTYASITILASQNYNENNNVSITDSLFYNSEIGISLQKGILFVNNTTFENNQKAFYQEGGNTTIDSSKFKNNYFSIYINSSEYTVIYNSKFLNDANSSLYIYDTQNLYVYNNFFNTTKYLNIGGSNNYNINFNTTKKYGVRIYTIGTKIGGNFFSQINGTTYSQLCEDSNEDGFCDDPFDLLNQSFCSLGLNCSNYTDYLPLSTRYGLSKIYDIKVPNTNYYYNKFHQINATIENPHVDQNITEVIFETNIFGNSQNITPIYLDPTNETKQEGVYSINTTGIQPGNYYLHVYVKSSDGYWNDTQVSFSITKSQPNLLFQTNLTSEEGTPTIKWFDVIKVIVNKTAWIDLDVHYRLKLDEMDIREFNSSQENESRVYYISNISSGSHSLSFYSTEGQNFTSSASSQVSFQTEKAWIKTDNITADEYYEYDSGQKEVPVEVFIENVTPLNNTVEVSKPIYTNITFRIKNTNGGLELSNYATFTNIHFFGKNYMPGWDNYTESHITISSLAYGEEEYVAVVFNNTTAWDNGGSCTVQDLSDKERHFCTFEVIITDRNITKNLTIVYKIPISSLNDFDKRNSLTYDVDGSTNNITVNISESYLIFYVGTNHSNSSLEYGTHYFHISYDVPKEESSGSSDSSSSSSSSGGGGGGGIAVDLPQNRITKIITMEKGKREIKLSLGPIDSIELSTKDKIFSEKMVIELKDAKKIEAPIGKKVFSSFEINFTANKSLIDRVNIKFFVNKSWIKQNNINRSSIALYKLVKGRWRKLPTEEVNETKEKIFYNAQTEGFSLFAILGEKKVETKIKEEKKNISIPVEEVNESEIINNLNITKSKEEKNYNKNIIFVVLFIFLVSTGVSIFFYQKNKRKKEKKIKSKKRRKVRRKHKGIEMI